MSDVHDSTVLKPTNNASDVDPAHRTAKNVGGTLDVDSIDPAVKTNITYAHGPTLEEGEDV